MEKHLKLELVFSKACRRSLVVFSIKIRIQNSRIMKKIVQQKADIDLNYLVQNINIISTRLFAINITMLNVDINRLNNLFGQVKFSIKFHSIIYWLNLFLQLSFHVFTTSNFLLSLKGSLFLNLLLPLKCNTFCFQLHKQNLSRFNYGFPLHDFPIQIVLNMQLLMEINCLDLQSSTTHF